MVILDNTTKEKELSYLIQKNIKKSQRVNIATGYFYISGYEMINESLNQRISKDFLRVIMGPRTNTETANILSAAYSYKQEVAILDDISNIILENNPLKIQKISSFFEHIRNDIIKFKIHPDYNFHAKLYLFIKDLEPINEWKNNKTLTSSPGDGIIGSSNFTRSGLYFKGNTELNLLISNPTEICSLNEWFERTWVESHDFNKNLLKIQEMTGIGLKEDPFNFGLYLKPKDLFLLLAHELLDGQIDLLKEEEDILYLYQQIGVLNAEYKIRKYYGVLIADSVGLGKSFIASQILKNYFLSKPHGRGDYWNGELQEKWKRDGKAVLFIVPSHLKKMWKEDYISDIFFKKYNIQDIDDDGFHFEILDERGNHLGEIKIISYAKFANLITSRKNAELIEQKLKQKTEIQKNNKTKKQISLDDVKQELVVEILEEWADKFDTNNK